MNGSVSDGKYIDTLDCEDPEYQRQMMRPVEVKEDVRQMEQRKRVQLILNSRAFRDELEDIVVEQQILGSPSSNDPAVSIQRLSEIIVPKFARMSAAEDGIGPCIPINDHRHGEASSFSEDELSFRSKVASLHRVFDMYGWMNSSKCSISGRLGQGVERFLVAPFGLPNNEVTSSSLIRIDMRGDVVETQRPTIHNGPSPQMNKSLVDKSSFLLHSALYASRPDIRCVAFLSNTAATCISSLKKGLLPISVDAVSLGEVGSFAFNGSSLNLEQRDKLRRVMGHSCKIVSVTHFGVLVAGESVEETFDLTRCFMNAVEYQLKQAMQGDLFKSGETRHFSEAERTSILQTKQAPQEDAEMRIWKRGELRYHALMRQLDDFGYKTGYPYKVGRVVSTAQPVKDSIPVASTKTMNNSNLPSKPNREDMNETINTSKSSKWNPEDASTPIKPPSNQAKDILSQQTVIDQTFTSNPKPAIPSSPQKSVSSTDGEVISPSKKKKKGFLSFNSKKKDKISA